MCTLGSHPATGFPAGTHHREGHAQRLPRIADDVSLGQNGVSGRILTGPARRFRGGTVLDTVGAASAAVLFVDRALLIQ